MKATEVRALMPGPPLKTTVRDKIVSAAKEGYSSTWFYKSDIQAHEIKELENDGFEVRHTNTSVYVLW